ncbi:MAG: hypothetical protein Q4B94_00140 [Pseudomonadota bacterium]|nr:hypothetical protein [Pseudomonadota bacterium]
MTKQDQNPDERSGKVGWKECKENPGLCLLCYFGQAVFLLAFFAAFPFTLWVLHGLIFG